MLCLSSGTDLKKSRHVLKSLSLCNKVLSYLILSLSLSLCLLFFSSLSPLLSLRWGCLVVKARAARKLEEPVVWLEPGGQRGRVKPAKGHGWHRMKQGLEGRGCGVGWGVLKKTRSEHSLAVKGLQRGSKI